jgi:protein-glutamine gamma-glutamyltransferase
MSTPTGPVPHNRSAGATCLVAAVVAGLSWAPTFSLGSLLWPVLAVLLPALVVEVLTLGRRGGDWLRPVLGLVLGACALVLTLYVLYGASPAETASGVVEGWQRTLDSTLPARPAPGLIAFVPALALLAGVLGTEWVRRGAGPAGALLPSLVVLGLGQLYRAATGWAALATVLAFGVAAVAVLLADRPGRQVAGPSSRRRVAAVGVPLLAVIAVSTVVAAVVGELAIPGQPTFSVQRDNLGTPRVIATIDPLDDIAVHLAAGEHVVFRDQAEVPVERWPLVVLDRLDGANWTSGAQLRTLGTEIPAQASTPPYVLAHAEISGLDLDGPWLPSQPRLQAADGIRALVGPATGSLVRDRDAADHYELSWRDIRVDAKELTSAAIDPHAEGAAELAAVPAGFAEVARRAVGADAAPTVAAALVLEKWMRDNFKVATGADIPTGHSTAKLLNFLNSDKRGTSEQFATAYALLARSLGIPIRVVVGFRDDGSGVVHDDDVLAWPEIAVSGLGWVPLDPTGGARTSSADRSGLDGATQAARETLPGADQLATRQPADEPSSDRGVSSAGGGLPVWPLGVLAGLVVAIAVVPVTKRWRRAWRRHRPPRAAVWGAWADTLDHLRDHRVPTLPGSTPRDLIGIAPIPPDDLESLARCVDEALWSGGEPDRVAADRAWAAAAVIRRSLRTGPRGRRMRAVFAVGTLRRRQPAAQLASRSG